MDRRVFLATASACALPILPGSADALPIPPGRNMHFRVLRNGVPIGDHIMQFNLSGASLTILTTASLLVSFAGIALFRYSVKATEIWENTVFQQLDSNVNFNGSPLQVHAERTALGYRVQGTHVPAYLAPLNLLPLTYWNKAMLDGTILNIQTAHSYPVTVTPNGWNALPLANGGSLVAQRFDLSGKLRLSIWYDRSGAWSGLEFQKSGDITYQKFN